MQINDRRDLYGGGLIMLIGAGAVLEGRRYDLGTLQQMGPGFFPVALGVILLFIGAMIAIVGTAAHAHDEQHVRIERPDWRGWGCIIVGVLSFMLLAEFVGLIPAIFACVLLSAAGDRTITLYQALVLSSIITVLGVTLFAFILQVRLPLLKVLGI